MRTLDPRLVRRARPVRTLLGVDAALGVGMALLVLLQATLHGARDRRGLRRRGARRRHDAARRRSRSPSRRAACWRGASRSRAAAPPWDVLSELRLAWSSGALRAQPAALDGVEGGEVAAAAVQGIDGLEAYFARYLPQVVLAEVVPVAVLVQVAWIDLDVRARHAADAAAGARVHVAHRALHRGARRGSGGWRCGSSPTHFLDVVRGLPTLRALNRGEAQAETIAEVGDRYRRATMGTLRVEFLSGAVLELAATLGVALVAVTVGVRLAGGGVGLRGRR